MRTFRRGANAHLIRCFQAKCGDEIGVLRDEPCLDCPAGLFLQVEHLQSAFNLGSGEVSLHLLNLCERVGIDLVGGPFLARGIGTGPFDDPFT